MINFDEEIKNYEPSLEIEEAESAIYSHDLTDVHGGLLQQQLFL